MNERQSMLCLAGAALSPLFVLALGAVSGFSLRPAHAVQGSPSATSLLWGKAGEKWTPQSRLPDFSWAGYHSGEASIPTIPVVRNVKVDFGAKGDGVTDDSDAFIAAIKAMPKGALLVPAGRYKITKVLQIRRSGIVLRGEGPGKTTLYCPETLKDVAARQAPGSDWNFPKFLSQPEHPKASRKGPFDPTGDFRFRGGFVWVEGEDKGTKLSDVTTLARRGDVKLTVADASRIKTGARLRLLQFDDEARTLGRYLHGDLMDAGLQTYDRVTPKFIDWVATVTNVQGKTITLDRPLRVDVRPGWKPQVWAYQPTVEEVGLEDLSFEFGGLPYAGHLKEPGDNATYFKQVANCWIRNVETVDADIAFNFEWMVRFSTIENVRMRSAKRPLKTEQWEGTGHHGVQFAYFVQDSLFTNFRFDTHFVHDITVDTLPNGNVFSHGSGLAVNFDHHRGAPYENLFTDIDLGIPRFAWLGSGQPQNGPRAGVRETFWNIRASQGGSLPPPPRAWDSLSPSPEVAPTWPDAVFVGLAGWSKYPNFAAAVVAHPTNKSTSHSARPVGDMAWIEPVRPENLMPQDLHLAQRTLRVGKDKP